MKTLLILRHGKSSWSSPSRADHDRSLKSRGERDAARIGRELRHRDLVPDLVLSSTARRARSTARLAAEAAGCAGRIVEVDELYLTGVGKQLEIAAIHAAEGHRRVMIVGHNPTLEDMVAQLTDEDARMTTANLACVDLEIEDWADLPHARGTLRFLLRPKELPAEA